MKEITVLGIRTTRDDSSVIDDKYDVLRDIDTYCDETLYMSHKTYMHDCDDTLRFRYRYAIESYTGTDGGRLKTRYHLYLVPTFNSLSRAKRQSVKDFASDSPNIADVFDCGIHVLLASECRDGGFDKSVADDIASVVDIIDGLRGFYLDGYQNRIGSTGWDYLYDFVKDVDCFKAALDRFKS